MSFTRDQLRLLDHALIRAIDDLRHELRHANLEENYGPAELRLIKTLPREWTELRNEIADAIVRRRRWCHDYQLGFTVQSRTPDASDVDHDDIRFAIEARLDNLCSNRELLEAVGCPINSEVLD